jgi:anthranilate synthase/aminodeoxychorismate synthase-like glutamine amidotransferase
MGVAVPRARGHVLFLENDDSFSWNLVDRLPYARQHIIIKKGRDVASDLSVLDGFSSLVIGPGPMDPVRVGLVNVVHEAARRRLPVLGVCLGHQAIGLAFGATLVRVLPMHGVVSSALFGPSRVFAGINGPVAVMRYNSLALTGVVAPLRVVASSPDGIPMAIEHDSLPIAGLQFHPDSYATKRGEEIIAAFFAGLP